MVRMCGPPARQKNPRSFLSGVAADRQVVMYVTLPETSCGSRAPKAGQYMIRPSVEILGLTPPIRRMGHSLHLPLALRAIMYHHQPRATEPWPTAL